MAVGLFAGSVALAAYVPQWSDFRSAIETLFSPDSPFRSEALSATMGIITSSEATAVSLHYLYWNISDCPDNF